MKKNRHISIVPGTTGVLSTRRRNVIMTEVTESVFPDELYQAPRSWAERAYPRNLIHYNRLDRGGHFAAWEQPQLFSEEIRASFRPLRNRAR
jgi:pimeloyl-ACP methyl ester carboxylesterase